MKTTTLKAWLLAAAMGAGALTACSDDEVVDNGGDTNSTVSDQSTATIESNDSIPLYDYWSKALANAQEGNDSEDSLEAANAQKTLAKMDSLWNDYVEKQGGNGDATDWTHGTDGTETKYGWWNIQIYNVRYNSVDQYGKNITLSELIVIPYNPVFGNTNPHDFVVYCHSPLATNYDRPSNFYQQDDDGNLSRELKAIARDVASGADFYSGVAVIPDYQGYGAANSYAYPSMNLDLLARQTIDGLAAAYSLIMNKKIDRVMDTSWTTTLCGYAEGASIAAATHRYMETHNYSSSETLAGKYRLNGSLLVDGIYDPEAMIENNCIYGVVYDPIQMARMIHGLCAADPNLRGKYTAEDFLSEKMVNTGILDFIEKKSENLGTYISRLLAASWKGDIDVYIPCKEKRGVEDKDYFWEKYNKEWYETAKVTYKADYRKKYKTGSLVQDTDEEPGTTDFYKDYVLGVEPWGIRMGVSQIFDPALVRYYNGDRYTVQGSDLKKCEALSKALAANNLCDGSWKPKYPMKVVYSSLDENLRPAINYKNFRAAMKNASAKAYYEITKYSLISDVFFFNNVYTGDNGALLSSTRYGKWGTLGEDALLRN